jgi:hypothetical protein
VSEPVHQTPRVVISDEEIVEAHISGKLSVELKAPLDTQRALSIAYRSHPGCPLFIVPRPLDPRVGPAVAQAVAAASKAEDV